VKILAHLEEEIAATPLIGIRLGRDCSTNRRQKLCKTDIESANSPVPKYFQIILCSGH
jgi:hypothetical protein